MPRTSQPRPHPFRRLLPVVVAGLAAATVTATASAQDGRELIKRILEAQFRLDQALPDPKKLNDDKEFAKLKEKALPPARDLANAIREVGKSGRSLNDYGRYRLVEVESLLYVLEDETTVKQTDEGAGKTDEANFRFKCVKLAADYYDGVGDEARGKVVDTLEAAADGRFDSGDIAGALSFMLSVTDSPALEDKILDFMRHKLTSEVAGTVATQYEAPRKLRNALGKPINFRGTTHDGKPFQLADLKGKVVMIHFFSASPEGYLRDINRINRIYITNRTKGVELVGIYCGTDKADLTLWLADYKRATFPILFDEFSAELGSQWPPPAIQNGVRKLPFTLLVDRQGILRYGNPDDLEVKLKELIEAK